MTDKVKDALDVAGSRIAKLVVGFALTYAAVKWKVELPPQYEWMRSVFEQIIASAFAASALGLAAHFGYAIRRNPDDTVSPTAMKVGRAKKAARKQTRALEARLAEAGLRARKPEVPYPTPADTPDEPPQLPMPDDPHRQG